MSNASDFIIKKGVLTKYVGPGGDVVIPEGVTAIGSHALVACRNITEVIIPEGVTSIGDAAFRSCENLARVTIPDSVQTIGTGAFESCKTLADENGFVVIRNILFDYCGPGGMIQIPEGVTHIDDCAFQYCQTISGVIIPEEVTSIGIQAFVGILGDYQIIAPHLPPEIFGMTDKKNAALYGFLHHPERYAQSENFDAYQSLVIAEKKKLLPMIFRDDLAAGLSIFGENGKITPTNFDKGFWEPAWEAKATQCLAYLQMLVDQGLFEKRKEKRTPKRPVDDPYSLVNMKKKWSYQTREDGTLMITSYKGTEKEVIIPERIGKTAVTALDDCAFAIITKEGKEKSFARISTQVSVVSIQIPDSIKHIGNRAFLGCSSLTNLEIPDSVEYIGEGAFWGCKKLADANGFVVVRDVLYYYCGNGGRVEIPESVKHISELAFRINQISFTTSLIPLEDPRMISITFPKSVVSLGKNVFPILSETAQITAPYLPFNVFEAARERRAAALGYLSNPGLYAQNSTLEAYQKYISAQRATLLDAVFAQDMVSALTIYEEKGFIRASNFALEYMEPAQKANAVGCVAYLLEWKQKNPAKRAFSQKNSELLADPYNPAKIKKLWTYDHHEDGTLMITGYKGTEKHVIVPERIGEMPVTRLNNCTFSSFTSFRMKPKQRVAALKSIVSIEIPDSVQSIGCSAFSGCTSLASIQIPSSVTSIEASAFASCSSLSMVEIPASVTTIESGVFSNCTSLTKVEIPSSVTSIEASAFSWCSSLSMVEIPASVTTIEESAFLRCEKLTEVEIPPSVTTIGASAFAYCKCLAKVTIPDSVSIIGKGAFGYCWDVVIHGQVGSYAESYAKENNIPFVAE